MIDVHLHGRLRALLPDGAAPLRLDVKTPAEAVRALCVLVEGFAAVLRDGHFRLEAGREVLTLDTLGLAFGRARAPCTSCRWRRARGRRGWCRWCWAGSRCSSPSSP